MQRLAEERALDALLDEALGGAGPPDLSEAILNRLTELSETEPLSEANPGSVDGRQGDCNGSPLAPLASNTLLLGNAEATRTLPPTPSATSVSSPGTLPSAGSPAGSSSYFSRREVVLVVTLVATVAAAWMLLVHWRSPELTIEAPRVAESEEGVEAPPQRPINEFADRPSASDGEQLELEGNAPPRRGIPLVLAPETGGPPLPDSVAVDRPGELSRSSVAQSIRFVSRGVESELHDYWASIGVSPSAERGPEAVSDRLRGRLGVEVSASVVGDVERVRHEIAGTDNAEQIATAWLDHITGGGLSRLAAERRQGLVAELTECFQGQRRLDETLSRWLGTDAGVAPDWYAALSAGGRPAMLRRLAALTMDVDLRCTRCHDSFVEGNGRQRDYWAFASLLSRDLQRQNGGAYVLGDGTAEGQDVFYDLLDGRRRFAEPKIPEHWLATAEDRPASLVQWASTLKGREELARGVVNSLWSLVHGRPLGGSAIDTVTAPRDASLDALERRLVDDLLASDFDVGRTLALIIDSPATSRSIPTEVEEAPLLAASLPIRQSVGAFAASLPHRAQLRAAKRLDIALSSIGGKLDSLPEGSALMAQIREQANSDRQERRRSSPPDAPVDYPTRADAFPVHWLVSLDDREEQIAHLAYLAGRSEVPDSVQEAVELMEEAGLSEELLLHRVWWLLKP